MIHNKLIQYARENRIMLSAYVHKKNLIDQKFFKLHEVYAMCLLGIETQTELCREFSAEAVQVNELLNNPQYKTYYVEKKRGGKREIQAPDLALKKLQKRINYYLQKYYLCIKPEAAKGFIYNPEYYDVKSNIYENAKPHVGKKVVLNIDLKDFFPSISAGRVKSLLLSEYFQFSDEIATILALLLTYKGKLPTGSPTSPVISNFICLQLDKDLQAFADTHELTYTRYADDLTFSSSTKITNENIEQVKTIVANHRFEINQKKFRITNNNRRQTVTGLTVNNKINVNRKFLKNTRAMLFSLSYSGLTNATQKHYKQEQLSDANLKGKFLLKLRGSIDFIGQIRGREDKVYLKLREEFDKHKNLVLAWEFNSNNEKEQVDWTKI